MSLKEISEELDLLEIYEKNKSIFKIISYSLDKQKKLLDTKYNKKIKDLQKEVNKLKKIIENGVSSGSGETSKSSIKEKINSNIRDKVMVNQYKDCILIHGNTWNIKSFIRAYPFVWNPKFKGWVKKRPFDEFKELVDTILDTFPKIKIQENNCRKEQLFKEHTNNQDIGKMFKQKSSSSNWMDKYAKTGIEPNSDDSDSDSEFLSMITKNKRIKVIEFNQSTLDKTNKKTNKTKKIKKMNKTKIKNKKNKKKSKKIKTKQTNANEYLMDSSD